VRRREAVHSSDVQAGGWKTPTLNNETGTPERMKDRTNEEPSDPVPGSLPDDAKWPGCGSTQHGGKNSEVQDETETWMEQVLDATNMQSAWHRVRRNGGAPGMDGMTIAQFPAFARQHWERIRAQLRDGSYHPAPVRRVFIPKPDGSQRPLGVPTVLDRVIQQAIAQVLTPLKRQAKPQSRRRRQRTGSSCTTERLRSPSVSLIGTARCGAACRVVWEG
jgi:hypothetical protein